MGPRADLDAWKISSPLRFDPGPSSFLKREKLASQIVWSVTEAATTVLCTPDDGRDGRPKHVQ